LNGNEAAGVVLGAAVLIFMVHMIRLRLRKYGYRWPWKDAKEDVVIEKDVENISFAEMETTEGNAVELWTVSNIAELEGSPPAPPPVPPKDGRRMSRWRPRIRIL
jgi:hypothetical protein